jgi:diaminohydroxyphosphoribosylaminopyrimidine deaminase/5-amino-6-(5-phosphoribosylamino)uracil reductase
MPQPDTAPSHPAQQHLTQALAQAQAALLRASPNPSVGCVLVNPQGQVIGQGSTQQAGGPHAEVMALRDTQARGHATAGATAYVTLEPCCHQGRTGPCTEALIGAGIGWVLAALPDPNPLVAGQGVAGLRAAGVAVEVASDSADPALQAWAAAARQQRKYLEALMIKEKEDNSFVDEIVR